MSLRLRSVLLLLGVLTAMPAAAQTPQPFDVLISGGHVIDGTGNPWFAADVGIRGGKIVAVGRLAGAPAKRTIDARGKLVTPGFIDIHSHADEGLESQDVRRRRAPNLVTQGVTTVVLNPDGGGPLSIADQKANLERLHIGLNAILMVPHNTIRRAVLGEDYKRRATPAEIAKMQALVRRGMEDGAFGMTAGLEYVPGIWSDNHEIIELVKEVVPYDGFYKQHERSGADVPVWWVPSQDDPNDVGVGKYSVMDNIRDLIQVAESTGARVVQTHLKVKGADYWGTSRAVIAAVNRARARGLEVYGDQYPYPTSGSDGSVTLIPGWALGRARFGEGEGEGGGGRGKHDYRAALQKTLADSSKLKGLKRDIAHEITYRGGADQLIVFDYPDTSYIGKSVAELAAARGQTPIDFAITMQLEGFPDRPGGARLRGFSFNEDDIAAFASQPWVATSSDAGIALPEDGPTVHARFYGTFPRKIRRYALDRGDISVQFAVRAQTSLPAQIIGLRNRGLLREGYAADVVVLDLNRLRDMADFTNPHQFADGIDYVLVNGTFVIDGEHNITGALPGVVITRKDGRAPPSLP
jgi:N-acyl-D-amino-acid deacylase